MNFISEHLLSLLIFLPILGVAILFFINRHWEGTIRLVSLLFMILDLVLCVWLFLRFDATRTTFQFVERVPWIPGWKVNYQVGVDGINILLVMLTGLLGPVVILSSWSAIEERVKEYHIFMLLLQSAMMGVFLSTDLFLFYVFWELVLIPMYFLIGIWGGPRRIYAAVKFFLFTMFGSVLMLIAIIWVYFYCKSFDLIIILNKLVNEPLARDIQLWLFGAFAIAFAIKVPMFPFHTWLPDAHVEAPTAGSVILAGVLLKMGTYGFIRLAMPLFPEAVYVLAPLFLTISVVGIIYGALVSMVQEDVKKLVAYSSVSHLGFVMLGLFALSVQSLQGAIIQMVNHGLSTGALFLLVGIIYERRHTREINNFGGLSKVMPLYAILFLLVSLSSIGLPGLNGFVGEFLILLGTFVGKMPHSKWFSAFAGLGVILSAVYLLWMYQRVFFGPLKNEENKGLKDLNVREVVYLSLVLIFIVWIGIYPKTFLKVTDASVKDFVTLVEQNRLKVQDKNAPLSPETYKNEDGKKK